MDRRAHVAMRQLAIINHILTMLDYDVQERRRRMAKSFILAQWIKISEILPVYCANGPGLG